MEFSHYGLSTRTVHIDMISYFSKEGASLLCLSGKDNRCNSFTAMHGYLGYHLNK